MNKEKRDVLIAAVLAGLSGAAGIAGTAQADQTPPNQQYEVQYLTEDPEELYMVNKE